MNILLKIVKDFFILLKYKVLSLFYKDKKKYENAWLFCERGVDAQDNAYHLFKYVRKKHPEINAYFIIDYKNKKACKELRKIGNIINYNSYEHKIAFMLSKVYICTHYGFITKCNYRLYKTFFSKNKKYIFLQHGIIQNDMSKVMNSFIIPFDLFLTSTNKEYNSIINNKKYGYNKNVVKLTGLPRYDALNNKNIKKQILFMPTWRRTIASLNGKIDKKKFIESDYFKKINELIHDKEIINFLEKENYTMVFYPHHEIQRYIDCFKTESKRVIIAKEKDYNVQTLLKESCFLITDYSSIFFDFAYMKKPIVYYQFDKKLFFKTQYEKGYFSYEKDGFGPAYEDSKSVVNYIIKNPVMEKKYKNRVDSTFKYNDNKNCERVYYEIIKKINE